MTAALIHEYLAGHREVFHAVEALLGCAGTDTACIQEAHPFIEHAWCGLVERALLDHPIQQGSCHAHRHDQ